MDVYIVAGFYIPLSQFEKLKRNHNSNCFTIKSEILLSTVNDLISKTKKMFYDNNLWKLIRVPALQYPHRTHIITIITAWGTTKITTLNFFSKVFIHMQGSMYTYARQYLYL